MTTEKLRAQKRTVFGKKVKQMRREGILPGIIYGKGMASIPVNFSLKDFEQLYKIVGGTNYFEIVVEDESFPVLVKQVAVHPLSDLPLHIDLYKVDLKQKVSAKVPVLFSGESEFIKSGQGMLLELISEIEIEALPADIPSNFTVDVSGLMELDSALTVGDITVPEGVEIKLDRSELLCKVDVPQMVEVVEEVVAPVEAEAEAGAEVKEEETAEKEPTE
jgi:large subunit ribosomal protein L25